ncbi:MAG: hypothetical protein EHM64_16905, partial [Ignavibacteriae bacterium]
MNPLFDHNISGTNAVKMDRWSLFMFVILLFSQETYGQQFNEAIEDNSFLIEEAFNQEDRVVQHIFNG